MEHRDTGPQPAFSYLEAYTTPMVPMARKIVGREAEILKIKAGLMRPEYCNVILLAPAGSGKTALVRGLMAEDKERDYLEVDLAKMIADLPDSNEMAARLKELFDEVGRLHKECGREIVLFMDEFHQVVQLSKAAVEALKPLLASSGEYGIKVIAATTLKEFDEFIAPNQPLVERLQRINLPEPDKMMTVSILKGFAHQYGVDHYMRGNSIYEQIYELTSRYIPSNAQPRKSILMLDAMVGWHRATGRPLDRKLLADVIYFSEGINTTFRVDADKIKANLDSVVFAQELATQTISDAMQRVVADLNDKSKPMASFIFSGATGTGKTEISKQLASILFGTSIKDDENQSSNANLIRFDMTEYTDPTSAKIFREELSQKVWERPFSIILLDEIEKSCAEVTRLLMQVLDDGRLTDKHGRQVVFTNAYIIMTTNAGSEIYKSIGQYNVSDTGDGSKLKDYMPLIKDSLINTTDGKFPPELVNRANAVIPFQPLSEETKIKIVQGKLKKLVDEVGSKHGVELIFDKKVAPYLVKDGTSRDSDAGGAREAVNKLNDEVITEVARFINKWPEEKHLNVVVRGRTAYENKGMLKSEAYIEVSAARGRVGGVFKSKYAK